MLTQCNLVCKMCIKNRAAKNRRRFRFLCEFPGIIRVLAFVARVNAGKWDWILFECVVVACHVVDLDLG